MIEIAPRIVLDEEVCSGVPIIMGTRIPVSVVVGHLAAGESIENLMSEYHLKREDVLASLSYAAKLVSSEEIRAVK
jgi:uncharacterized protein (DUF433 family)